MGRRPHHNDFCGRTFIAAQDHQRRRPADDCRAHTTGGRKSDATNRPVEDPATAPRPSTQATARVTEHRAVFLSLSTEGQALYGDRLMFSRTTEPGRNRAGTRSHSRSKSLCSSFSTARRRDRETVAGCESAAHGYPTPKRSRGRHSPVGPPPQSDLVSPEKSAGVDGCISPARSVRTAPSASALTSSLVHLSEPHGVSEPAGGEAHPLFATN
jgi:hypothetical protein